MQWTTYSPLNPGVHLENYHSLPLSEYFPLAAAQGHVSVSLVREATAEVSYRIILQRGQR